MTPEVKRYLRWVTCLLPGTAARRVRAELHAHLYHDALDAQLRGLDESAAWREALRAAGPAWLAALRFARIYTLGTLGRVLLIGAALGGAAYAMQTHSLHADSVPGATPLEAQP